MKKQNKIFDCEDCLAIQLTQGKVTVFDREDLPLLVCATWYASKEGKAFYAKGNAWENGKTVKYRLHRVILGITDPKIFVDHINGDTLDNRKRNLRVATSLENNANRRKGPGTSKYKGVRWHPKDKAWHVRLTISKHTLHIGMTKDEDEAGRMYNEIAHEWFGPYAKLNEVA